MVKNIIGLEEKTVEYELFVRTHYIYDDTEYDEWNTTEIVQSIPPSKEDLEHKDWKWVKTTTIHEIMGE